MSRLVCKAFFHAMDTYYTQDIESELEADEVKLFYQALGLSGANNNGADNNNKDNKNNGDTGGSGNTNNTSSNV